MEALTVIWGRLPFPPRFEHHRAASSRTPRHPSLQSGRWILLHCPIRQCSRRSRPCFTTPAHSVATPFPPARDETTEEENPTPDCKREKPGGARCINPGANLPHAPVTCAWPTAWSTLAKPRLQNFAYEADWACNERRIKFKGP